MSPETALTSAAASRATRALIAPVAGVLAFVLVATVVWWVMRAGSVPDPTAAGTSSAAGVADIGVLVLREGLESVLVISVITASMVGSSQAYRRPIVVGIAVALAATLLTWQIAVGIINDISGSVSALQLQAATGLLAIIVLLVVMNWFFHKLYWTGWISLHNRRKKDLLQDAATADPSRFRLLLGFGLLGFTSMYREGFEVVLFLQSYRLKLGTGPVFRGVALGVALTAIIAVITFVLHRRLPFRRMLVATGVMLGVVLLVMVGEQAQEMQLAHWIPTTTIPWLQQVIPAWLGLWLSVFPTVETLVAQGVAGVLVIGSYVLVRAQVRGSRAPSAVEG
ncbi:MAG TPA: FTR1 family protein [Gemmatimonadales bacterium]|jgi:high-affinity iron transporter|nr:FTR1 family protein [Gemmatimonadales bacterium]